MSSCTFCGHHDAPESISHKLVTSIEKLILENQVETFYVGNHGSFDRMALGALRDLKKKYPHISYYVVLAYLPEKKEEFPLYADNETLLPDGIENTPKRFAISFRNKWMVDNSDYIISYVKHHLGGASKTMDYAAKKQLAFLNL